MEVQGKRSGKVVCLCVWGIVACTKAEQRSDFCPSHPTVTGHVSVHPYLIHTFNPILGFPGAARLQPEEPPQLLRTRSDVGVRRRGSARTPSEQRRIRRHRFSINGHFYNHKASPGSCPTPGTGVGWGWVVEAALGEKDGGFGAHGGEMNVVPLRHQCSHRHTAPSPMSG